MIKTNLKIYKRRSIFSDLDKFEPDCKKSSFIECTEWTNGDGVDISISNYSEKYISLSWGEAKAIHKLVKKLSGKPLKLKVI